MKKTLAKFLAFTMLLSLLAVPAMAATWTGNNTNLNANGGTVTGTINGVYTLHVSGEVEADKIIINNGGSLTVYDLNRSSNNLNGSEFLSGSITIKAGGKLIIDGTADVGVYAINDSGLTIGNLSSCTVEYANGAYTIFNNASSKGNGTTGGGGGSSTTTTTPGTTTTTTTKDANGNTVKTTETTGATTTEKTSAGTTTKSTVTKTVETTAKDGTKTTVTTETTVVDTKNNDGSADKTTTERTTGADGKVSTKVTEEVKTADGSTGTTVTTNGTTTTAAEASVSASAVSTAAANDAVVTLPVSINAADKAEGAASVKVTMPATVTASNPAEILVPVTNVGPTDVLVLVKADGTEEIIKDAAMTDKGLVLTAEGSFTVKVADNAKTFADAASIPAWAKDSVAFVTARGIFNGTGESFETGLTMSRGMIAQVLFNFDKNSTKGVANTFSDVSSSDWFADAAAWCASESIMQGTGDGFDGNVDVTREQLATTLYRYAQAKGYDTTVKGDLSSFNDASAVSSWATEAMQWAVGAGLINGMDGGVNAQGNATRGQVAAIMERFCNNVAH